jgi:hypothetical protein
MSMQTAITTMVFGFIIPWIFTKASMAELPLNATTAGSSTLSTVQKI